MQKIRFTLIDGLLLLVTILYLLSAGVLFIGCAAQKKVAAKVVVERPCITKVELSENTRCSGVDAEHLHCTGIVLSKIHGCETLQIEKEKKQ